MKLRTRSFIPSLLGNLRLPGTGTLSGADATPVVGSNVIPTANLQALAAELHQSSTQGLFEYPRNWVLITKVAGVMLMAGAMLKLLSFIKPIQDASRWQLPLERIGVSPWQLVAAAFGILIAFTIAALLINFFPSIRVTPQGLGISELIGWRRIPWAQVGVLRVMELEQKGRYVVLIPFRGATRPPTPAPVLQLIPALAGASRNGERGLLITSDINDFDRMLQLMVSYMAQSSGQSVPRVELFINEGTVMPITQMVLEPEAAIVRLARPKARVDVYGMPDEDVEPELNWRDVLTRQALISIPPTLLLLVTIAARGAYAPPGWAHLLWALTLLGFGILELPFAAKLVQTVGDMMVGSGRFKRTVWAYLELQVPRAALIMLGLALLGMGLPAALAQICWLAGIGVTTWLTIRFVQRLYYVTIAQTLIAGIGCLFFQIVLYALYFGLS